MLEVKNLCKTYPSFKLDNISFKIEDGFIYGFIGMNGAGKTTTLKSMLNLTKADSGDVIMDGKSIKESELELKRNIGFMLGEANYYPKTKLSKLTNVFKRFFDNWDEDVYRDYLKKFALDESKTINELSTGMRVKYSITLALSHGAKLLIFDEPTSGLDPIARREIAEIFQQVILDGKTSVLFSTHITSDLDKCADYILFIKEGKLIGNDTKDAIIDKHCLVAGKKSALSDDLKNRLIGYKKNAFGFTGLMLRSNVLDTDDIELETPNLEDIMVYYNEKEAE